MATVTGLTAARMLQLLDDTFVGASINSLGNLILKTRGGASKDVGAIMPEGLATQYFRGDKTWVMLDKNAVGLNLVDNVADTEKPVSTPQLTALNKLAKGLLSRNPVTSSSGASSDNIINNIPTYTFKAGRKYRIVWDASYYQSAVTDLFFWSICSAPVGDAAALLTNLTMMGGRTKGVSTAGSNVTNYTGPVTAYYDPLVDITLQIKFRVQRALGAGTTVIRGDVNEIATYLIYDDGAQTLV